MIQSKNNEIPEGNKNTEIGVIPIDWDIRRIEDIATVDPENLSSSTSPDYRFKYIVLEDVNEGVLKSHSEKVFSTAPSRARRKIKKGDVLFGTVRPNLKSHLLFNENENNWICSTGFSVIRSREDISVPGYIFSHLFGLTIKRQIDALLTGSNYSAINSRDVKKLMLQVPGYAEQCLIATTLNDVNALIAKMESLIEKKKNIKQSTMRELLTGKRRLPGFSGDWKSEKLGEMATIYRGASPRPIADPKWFNDQSDVGWVRISDVTDSKKYLHRTTQKLSDEGIVNSRRVNKDNLIMSICATIGRPIITKLDVCIHDGFVVFDKLQNDLDFIYYFLTYIEDKWSRHGQTGSQMNLNTTIIQSETCFLPEDKIEQAAIANTLSDIDSEISKLELQLEKYKNIKQGMMQKLLTGKIRLIKK